MPGYGRVENAHTSFWEAKDKTDVDWAEGVVKTGYFATISKASSHVCRTTGTGRGFMCSTRWCAMRVAASHDLVGMHARLLAGGQWSVPAVGVSGSKPGGAAVHFPAALAGIAFGGR